MKNRAYIAIDLKSFYASVECMERGFDPLTTNLVVADASRTEKTICLAVSPSLKSYGIPGRARLFEVVQKVKEVNAARLLKAPGRVFSGISFIDTELKASPGLELDYIVAPPRMADYIAYSTRIYNVYLKYIAPEDNLYLCKIAMDIQAKHIPADNNGMRIAELDEMSYRRLLWSHQPLTDFWRVGKGYATKLLEHGLHTMGDIARCSLGGPNDHFNEDLLYKLFGINAELLIDHAWGWEPCTMADIKAYKPSTSSIGSGQVLHTAYPFDKAKLIVREMTDLMVLDLVDKRLVTDQLVLSVGYDIESLTDPMIKNTYHGEITTDPYGRAIPKSAHGSINLDRQTSSTKLILDAATELFERIVDKNLLVRRVNITANHVVDETSVQKADNFEQLDLFTDYAAAQAKKEEEEAALEREKKMQKAMLEIKKKHGKNAILKGMNLQEGATTVDRNRQIGGHKA